MIYNILDKLPCKVILDVGCGKGSFAKFIRSRLPTAYVVGLEIYRPYLIDAKEAFDDVILCDVRFLPIRNKAVNAVIANQVIEHLSKADGYKFLTEANKIAINQVIITTPVGSNPKHHLENGNPWQEHKSSWHPNEFKSLGYRVIGYDGLKTLKGEKGEFRIKSKNLALLLSALSILTQFVTYKLVSCAYQMLCIKEHVPALDDVSALKNLIKERS